jgi:hypothetical protein
MALSIVGLWFLGEPPEEQEDLDGTTVVRGTGEPLSRVELRLIPRAQLSSLREPGEGGDSPRFTTTWRSSCIQACPPRAGLSTRFPRRP